MSFQAGRRRFRLMAGVVDEHYFATTKTDILQGRAFTADDNEGSRRVAIVNEEFAKRYWPGENAMGKRLRLNGNDGVWADVVGIARTGKYLFIAEQPTPFVYLPFAQNPSLRMILLAESYGDPASLTEPLRNLVHSLDVDQPVYNVQSFSSFYEQRAVRVPLMILQTVAAMGVMGIALALVGIYALVSYSVGAAYQRHWGSYGNRSRSAQCVEDGPGTGSGAVHAGHYDRRVDQRRCRSLTRGWTDRSRSSQPRDIRGGSRSGAVSHHGRVLRTGAARVSGRSDRCLAIRMNATRSRRTAQEHAAHGRGGPRHVGPAWKRQANRKTVAFKAKRSTSCSIQWTGLPGTDRLVRWWRVGADTVLSRGGCTASTPRGSCRRVVALHPRAQTARSHRLPVAWQILNCDVVTIGCSMYDRRL